MGLFLVLLGVAAWAGVAGLAILMAHWGEPVWGFFPIAAAVVAAWAIGEYLTTFYLKRERPR
jgi:hypothetical protein